MNQLQSLYKWTHCDLCDKLMPFKRWEGTIKNYLECLGCGNNIVEQKEEAA